MTVFFPKFDQGRVLRLPLVLKVIPNKTELVELFDVILLQIISRPSKSLLNKAAGPQPRTSSAGEGHFDFAEKPLSEYGSSAWPEPSTRYWCSPEGQRHDREQGGGNLKIEPSNSSA